MAEALALDTRPTALQGLGRMAPWRQLALLVGIAGAVALGVWLALWSQTPSYGLLVRGLQGDDVAEVLRTLEEAQVPYRVDDLTGAVMVPAKQVRELRAMLGARGLPRGKEQGYEFLSGDGVSFGTHEAVLSKRVALALEIELARTISELAHVRSARVHIAAPRQSAFLKRHRKATAAVFVQSSPGRTVEREQAMAIAQMVAAAVSALEPENVRVLDGRGNLLTTGAQPDLVSRSELDYARSLETGYIARIEDLLGPVVGMDAVTAQVVAEVDFSYLEESTERYDPERAALRSEQLSEDRAGAREPLGIPGALSNQPPDTQAQAPETTERFEPRGENAQAAQAKGRSRSRSTRNFEIDRTVTHVRRPSGQVRRLSAAVVVDHRTEQAPDGQPRLVPRTPEEIERYTSLVKKAIGFDEERGDTVSVINEVFTRPAPIEPLPEPPIWEQQWVWDIARQVGGALAVLLLGLGVLRPVMRNLVAREVAEREIVQTETARLAAAEAEVERSNGEGGVRDGIAQIGAGSGEANLDAIRTLINDDPRRAANTVKSWMQADG